MAGQPELVFAALGGVGEIGMNLALYGLGPANDRRWIAVDCGIAFPGPDLPGVDVIFPDIAFLEKERQRLLAIIITHAHEDHIGALATLWPRLRVPVYASPFAAGLFAAKQEADSPGAEIRVRSVNACSRIDVGPFDIEFIAMAHSIPESMALAIRTPLGTVVHSGDWKIDPEPLIGRQTDVERLKAIGEEGVLALICDSTNAGRSGRSPSEGEVGRELTKLVGEAQGRVAFTLFSSNVARIRSIALAAQAAGREVIVVGRALWRVIEVAREQGYMADAPTFREADALNDLPAGNVVMILSGSQGEPRAAMARIAAGEDKLVRLGVGDIVVFSSRTIPGNERPIIDITNQLIAAGVTVITDRDRLVHVSGHPRRDELRDLYAWLKPQIVVPVHGEAFHLAAQTELARSAGVPKVLNAANGTLARLAPDPAIFPQAIPTGRIYRDGTIVGGKDELGIPERRRMSFAGHISVSILLDHRGELEQQPQFVLSGVPERDPAGNPMARIVAAAIRGAVVSIPRPRRRDAETVSDAVRRSVRAAVAEVWGKKPVCSVLVSVIE